MNTKSLTKNIAKHFEIPGTDVQFSRKLKLLEETLDEILNVCDVIGTEQHSMKTKMTSLQVQMDSVGVSRPGKCRMSVVSFSKWNLMCTLSHFNLSAMTISVTVQQSIAGLRWKLHTHVADAMLDKEESCTYKKIKKYIFKNVSFGAFVSVP